MKLNRISIVLFCASCSYIRQITLNHSKVSTIINYQKLHSVFLQPCRHLECQWNPAEGWPHSCDGANPLPSTTLEYIAISPRQKSWFIYVPPLDFEFGIIKSQSKGTTNKNKVRCTQMKIDFPRSIIHLTRKEYRKYLIFL